MKPDTILKLKQAVALLEQAQKLISEAYVGDSADETLDTIDYAIEDLKTDIELFSE